MFRQKGFTAPAQINMYCADPACRKIRALSTGNSDHNPSIHLWGKPYTQSRRTMFITNSTIRSARTSYTGNRTRKD